MIIKLSPVRSDSRLIVVRKGDTLTLNGIDFDFSPLQEGDHLPASAIDSKWFIGEVTRKDSEINVSIILPHGVDAPEATRFPLPITVSTDGPVILPEYGDSK